MPATTTAPLATWPNGRPGAIPFEGMPDTFILLTACCGASGKGSADSMSGVVCRSCHATVSGMFGGVYPLSELEEQTADFGMVLVPQLDEHHVPDHGRVLALACRQAAIEADEATARETFDLCAPLAMLAQTWGEGEVSNQLGHIGRHMEGSHAADALLALARSLYGGPLPF